MCTGGRGITDRGIGGFGRGITDRGIGGFGRGITNRGIGGCGRGITDDDIGGCGRGITDDDIVGRGINDAGIGGPKPTILPFWMWDISDAAIGKTTKMPARVD